MADLVAGDPMERVDYGEMYLENLSLLLFGKSCPHRTKDRVYLDQTMTAEPWSDHDGPWNTSTRSKFKGKNFAKYQNKLNKMFKKLEKACRRKFSEVSFYIESWPLIGYKIAF